MIRGALLFIFSLLLSPVVALEKHDEGHKCMANTLYLVHIGESDKPLMPLTTCAQCPNPDEAKKIIGEPFWRYRNTQVVSGEEICAIERELRTIFSIEKPEEPGLAYFGTFKLILVKSGTPSIVYLNKNHSITVINAVAKVVSESNPELSSHLQGILRRLGVTDMN